MIARLWRMGMLFILAAGPTRAALYTWNGAASGDWSNGANWTNGTPPPSTGNDTVRLQPDGFAPVNQDIEGLSINTLIITNMNGLVIGGRAITLKSINSWDGGTAHTNTFACPLILSSLNSWHATGKSRLVLLNTLGETGGSRFLSVNGGGFVQFQATNTFTGGLRNNQATVYFFEDAHLGPVPAAPVSNFFESGYGGWGVLNTGTFRRVTIHPNRGMRTIPSGPGFHVAPNTKVVYNGPIVGNGSFQKLPNATGTLVLGGDSSFTGGAQFNGGVTILTHSNALGFGAPGTSISLIGTLDANGNDITTRSLNFVNGFGWDNNGEFINSNTSRPVTVHGLCHIGGGAGGNCWQFGGPGDVVILGTVSNTNGYALRKLGSGTLVMKGSNIYPSATSVRAGGLTLDYTAWNESKLGDAAPLYVMHGRIALKGNAGADTLERTGELGIGNDGGSIPGAVDVTLEPAADRNLTLACSNLTFNAYYTMNVNLGENGSGTAALTVTNADTLCGGLVTVNRSSFMTVLGGQVLPIADSDYVTSLDAGIASNQLDLPAGTNWVNGSATVGKVRIRGEATTLTITNGARINWNGLNTVASPLRPGLLVTPEAGPAVIDGEGIIDMGLNQVFPVHQYSTNPLAISARFAGSGSGNQFVKCGPGELILTHTNNLFPNPFQVFGGTLTISNIRDAGTNCAIGGNVLLHMADSTLTYNGTGDTHNRRIVMRGPVTINASGSGPFRFTGATNVLLWSSGAGSDFDLTLAGSGAGILDGILDLHLGGVRKAGPGTWTLSGAQPYTGATTVDDGTLVLTNSCVLERSLAVGPGGTIAGSATVREDLLLDGRYQAVLRPDGSADSLTVGHDAILNGEIALAPVPGFKPAPGQSFVIMQAGGSYGGAPVVTTPYYTVAASGAQLVATFTPPRAGAAVVIY